MSAGRTTVRTPEVRARLVEALKLGATYDDAVQAAGLGRSAFYAWRREDDQFAEELEAARAYHRLMALRRIERAAKRGDWKAASYLLDRHAKLGPREAPNNDELRVAAEHGITSTDAAVMWQRQLQVLESAYQRGEVDAVNYLSHMSRLTAEARHLADQRMRQLSPDGTPQVALSLTLDSTGIRDPAPLPAGVEPTRRASAGGDLIDVG